MEIDWNVIKYVAMYLRKSRGEGEADLIKHKTLLSDLCKERNWAFVEYCEIASGDNITMRPVLQRLLKDVQANTFDAVLVVDIDRLSRGDLGELDHIKKILHKSKTLLCDRHSILNLGNGRDEFWIDIRGLMAREEYKQIIERLTRGKKFGSKLGKWTNGIPPFPYEYQQWGDKFRKQGLVVNENKLTTYDLVKHKFIAEGKTPRVIAAELNSMGLYSPRGLLWSGMTIQRMLVDETHLGRIVSNKTKGNGHKVKKPTAEEYTPVPKEDWIRVENCHEAVKTLEEHEQILAALHRRKLGITRVRRPSGALSGIIKCGVCGRTMQQDPRQGHQEFLKRCWYTDGYGKKCPNRGGSLEIVFLEIDRRLTKYEEALRDRIRNSKVGDNADLRNRIAAAMKEELLVKERLARIYDLVEKGMYSKDEFVARRGAAESNLETVQEHLKGLRLQLKVAERRSDAERLSRLEDFRQHLTESLSPADRNSLYRTVIDSIEWVRLADDISLKINFL